MLSLDIWRTRAISGDMVAYAVILTLAFFGALFSVPTAGALFGADDSLVPRLAVAAGAVEVATSVRAVVTGVVAVGTESAGLAPHEELKFAEISTLVAKIKAHHRFRLQQHDRASAGRQRRRRYRKASLQLDARSPIALQDETAATSALIRAFAVDAQLLASAVVVETFVDVFAFTSVFRELETHGTAALEASWDVIAKLLAAIIASFAFVGVGATLAIGFQLVSRVAGAYRPRFVRVADVHATSVVVIVAGFNDRHLHTIACPLVSSKFVSRVAEACVGSLCVRALLRTPTVGEEALVDIDAVLVVFSEFVAFEARALSFYADGQALVSASSVVVFARVDLVAVSSVRVQNETNFASAEIPLSALRHAPLRTSSVVD